MEFTLARIDFKRCGKYLFDIWLQAICERTKLRVMIADEGNWTLLKKGVKVPKLSYGIKLCVPENFISNDDLELVVRAIETWPCPGKIWFDAKAIVNLGRDIDLNFHWDGDHEMFQSLKGAEEFLAL